MRQSMLQYEYELTRKKRTPGRSILQWEAKLTAERGRRQSRQNALRRKSITAQDIINGAKRLFR